MVVATVKSATAVAVITMELDKNQIAAVDLLKTGSILRGGVGSGKSRTALTYFFAKVCGGSVEINGKGKYIPPTSPKDLYIITTAKKRDSHEWEKEFGPFLLSLDSELSVAGIKVTIDSWNNIPKFCNTVGAFFIFDEQRLVGSGKWVKSFYQIAKKNEWILLTATPGDTWMDYIPVFVANGFYKNRTEFLREHVIFNRFAKYPKVDRYVSVQKLINLKHKVIVDIVYVRPTARHDKIIPVSYNREFYKEVAKTRWNPYTDEPIKNASEYAYTMRKITNSDDTRAYATKKLIEENPRLIIFYTFDYELYILRQACSEMGIYQAEWNGHKHMPCPETDKWVYLVQYTSASEAWECITTDAMLFYSDNHSYKMMEQAHGRIDRRNTPFTDLYYYHLRSSSPIDMAIARCLSEKRDFNEDDFYRKSNS